jgi:LysM repeat protein
VSELVKAEIRPENGAPVPCMFNPSELTISRSTSWGGGEAKGGNAPELRFQGGQSGTLSMSLTFDTTGTGTDVSTHTNRLLGLMDVDPSLPGTDRQRNSGRPPLVQFHWGHLHSFQAIVERVQVRYTYFADNGMPLRAKAEVSLKQYKDESTRPLQNPTSHTDTLHATHRVVAGETLDRVAARHYRDASQWRVIADANGVLDPLDVQPGTLLAVPELPVRRRG